jgi:prepilin-type N-terminal cleavage/methylation domain-containing protein
MVLRAVRGRFGETSRPGTRSPAGLARNRSRPAGRAAFTLTELLVVISIVAILLGLLYGAIRTVNRYSRETITRGELANLEAAWKQYYAYYHVWPTNNIEADGDARIEIDQQIAAMLSGHPTNGLNPDAIPFLDFTRFNSKDAAPISAWGDRGGERYIVRLDANGDNTLNVPLDKDGKTSNSIYRQVAVWTANPELPPKIIANWQQ